MDNKEVILFGAGEFGKKTWKIMQDLNINVKYFIDSDKEKHGNLFCGVPVISFEEYNNKFINTCYINISTTVTEYYEKIKKDLISFGTKEEFIVNKEIILRRKIELSKESIYQMQANESIYQMQVNETINQMQTNESINQMQTNESINQMQANDDTTYIFDTGEWGFIGGIETYNFTIARNFIQNGYSTKIIFPHSKKYVPEDLRDHVINFNFYSMDNGSSKLQSFASSNDILDINFKEKINQIIHIITENMPCVIILSGFNAVYVAASLLRDKYPDQIKIIGVIHEETREVRLPYAQAYQDFNATVCVNNNIVNKQINEFGYSKDKISYKYTPVDLDGVPLSCGAKIKEGNPIILGYLSRIEVLNKRSDLIIEFVNELERLNINYIFNIAGDGAYLKVLKKQIAGMNLGNKVNFLGYIEHSKVKQFWDQQHIFLNFSDREGLCLSMIEALICGKPCISTHIHNEINHFIINNENGYVVDIGDMKQMAEKVKHIDENRFLIEEYGEKSVELARTLSDVDDYRKFLLELV